MLQQRVRVRTQVRVLTQVLSQGSALTELTAQPRAAACMEHSAVPEKGGLFGRNRWPKQQPTPEKSLQIV